MLPVSNNQSKLRPNMLDAALMYASQGVPVFPCYEPADGRCSCGNTDCHSVGKHPRTSHGYKNATTDVEELRRSWQRYPHANVAAPTGSTTGFVVIDVDPENGGTGTLEALVGKYGLLPDTPTCTTGRHGRHIYFKCPNAEIRNDAGRILGLGVDVRANGGYVILPPSVGVSRTYEWLPGRELGVCPLADLPDWMLSRLTPKDTSSSATAMEKALHSVRIATEGSRNNALNRAAYHLGQFVARDQLPRPEVEQELLAAAVTAGLPESEARRTIASGLDAGETKGFQDATIVEHAAPIPLAEHYLQHGRSNRLVRWQGQFYEFAGTHYVPVGEEEVQASLYWHLHTLWVVDNRKNALPGDLRKIIPTATLVREVRLALISVPGVLLPNHLEEPAWLNA